MRTAALSILLFVCLPSAFAAGYDVTTPVYGPSPLAPGAAVVATNGTSFLSLWQFGNRIYGSLAEADGRFVNAIPFEVLIANVQSFNITAIGSDYLLYWNDGKNTYLGDLPLDGKVTNIRGPISVRPLYRTSIAMNGSEICVVGETRGLDASMGLAHILRRDGSIVAHSLDVSNTFGLREVIASSDDFIITATENAGVFVYRFGSNGVLRPPGKIAIPVASRFSIPVHAVAASSGDEVVVVWSEHGDPSDTFWSTILSSHGDLAQRRRLEVTNERFISDSGVVWDGHSYVATALVSGTSSPPTTIAMHLDLSGALLDSPVVVGGVTQHITAGNAIVYGIGITTGFPVLVATSFRSDGSIRGAQSGVLSVSPAAQRAPSVASDGIDFLTAFAERTGTTQLVKAAAVSPVGTQLIPEGIRIANSVSTLPPAIARGGSIYLIVWADWTAVYARRVRADGTALDAQPITIGRGSFVQRPDVIWNGSSFLVVWVGTGGIVGALIEQDGDVSSTRLVAPYGSMEPRVAWNGKTFLVVYGVPQPCYFECIPRRAATLAVRVAPDGTPIDTIPMTIDAASTSSLVWVGHATVASNGADFLVALDSASGVSVATIKTDSTSLSVGTPRTVFQWFAPVMSDITWDGNNYVVTWIYPGAGSSWLATARVEPNGDQHPRSVISFAGSNDPPALANNSLGETLVAVSEPEGNPLIPRVRAYFDWELKTPPAPPAPPTNVAAIGTPGNFAVIWNAGTDAEGVVIETATPEYVYPIGVATASDRMRSFTNTIAPFLIVRTFNAGGLSEPVTVGVQPAPRHRAVSR